jgi:MFS family permease
MYDFMVFGYFASAIGEAFFPATDHFAFLISSLMTFGVGFLMRPTGALILGAYIDRYGRRAGLILTLALMSVGTIGLGFTPGFAVIGIAAPLIIVFSRLLQGFSAGVELGGVSVYLAELATPGHKGFYVSWQSASQQAAVMFTALLGVVLGAILPVQAMKQWGWRIPFLIGCLIIPVLFLLRRFLPETEAFRVRKHRPSANEVWRTRQARMGVRPRFVTFHFSPFTFHQSPCRTEPRPASLPYALAADNFCTSSLVSFTSAKRNKGLSCSGARALAIGATTVG